MAFNKTILVGNLVNDPELKQTQGGVSVTSFRIAVGRRFAKEGEQQADFIDIVAWRGTAEFICKHFCKGKGILVCGALQSRTWADSKGNKRFATEVVADEVSFVEKKESVYENHTPMTYEQAVKYSGNTTGEVTEYEEMTPDDDLPF